MPLKTIKDVDEKTWTELKVLSAKRGVKMGKMLEEIVNEYTRRSKERWEELFKMGKTLSDKEAEEMKKIVKELRKEKGFRE